MSPVSEMQNSGKGGSGETERGSGEPSLSDSEVPLYFLGSSEWLMILFVSISGKLHEFEIIRD